MANTLTGLAPIIFEALDVVSRELVGFIPAVTRDTAADRAALGQSVNFPIVAPGTVADIAPAATGPTGNDTSAPAGTLTISKAKSTVFYLTGEDDLTLRQTSAKATLFKNAVAQGMRALCNLIELDLANAGSTALRVPMARPARCLLARRLISQILLKRAEFWKTTARRPVTCTW